MLHLFCTLLETQSASRICSKPCQAIKQGRTLNCHVGFWEIALSLKDIKTVLRQFIGIKVRQLNYLTLASFSMW